MGEFISVADIDEIPVGEGRSFEVGDRVIAVFNIDGKFSAIDDLCPHMGASLSAGDFDSENCHVACPWHGWRFHVQTGAWADNPRIQTDVFQVRVKDGKIQVEVDDVEDAPASAPEQDC